ncbi:GPP34 family phosphoprotein [Streptomyces sp. NPDC003077]|uniref:GOLPH3/VPS74 family protein n=1 Tax=Streptomyces sp. NPDC003077 TaxID=3154443 RepID=UPI00339E0EFF
MNGPSGPVGPTGPTAPTGLTLPEELLLLGLDPETGRTRSNRSYLRYGLAGAALAELEWAGRVAEGHGRRITVLNPLPLQDPVLDAALATLPHPSGKGGGRQAKARVWVRRAAREVEEACRNRLVERGAVRRETRRLLGIFPYERLPAGQAGLSWPVRERFRAALEAGLPEPRYRTLAALAAAVDLAPRLLPGRAEARRRRELKRLAREEWTVHAVLRAVQQDKSSSGGDGGDGGGGGGDGGG